MIILYQCLAVATNWWLKESNSKRNFVAVEAAVPVVAEAQFVISDLDIYRAANLLIKEHGADAEIVAAQRADQMLDQGDIDGLHAWKRIRRAIVELLAPATGKPN